MSDGVIIAIVGAVTGVANTIILAYMNGHIKDIKVQTNGMSKRLEDAAQAKGNLEGRAEQKEENQNKP